MVKNTLALKERILEYLIENKNTPHSIREISNHLKVDYKNTFQSVNSMPDAITKDKFGNTCIVQIKTEPNNEVLNIETKRSIKFLENNKKIKLIKNDIEKIKYPFMIVLLFGSTIKKTNTKYSDLDLCIISDNEEKKKQLIRQLKLLSMNIEFHEFTIDEFNSMLETRKENISDEIIKNNIILYGTEAYYNLISKWTKRE